MQDIEKLKETFKSINFTPTTSQIALNELANALNASEVILLVLEGSFKSTVGLLAATDLRVLYVGCSPIKDSIVKSIGYTEISSIEFKSGDFEFSGTVEIKATETFTIKGCPPFEAEKFIQRIYTISEEKKRKRADLKDLGY